MLDEAQDIENKGAVRGLEEVMLRTDVDVDAPSKATVPDQSGITNVFDHQKSETARAMEAPPMDHTRLTYTVAFGELPEDLPGATVPQEGVMIAPPQQKMNQEVALQEMLKCQVCNVEYSRSDGHTCAADVPGGVVVPPMAPLFTIE